MEGIKRLIVEEPAVIVGFIVAVAVSVFSLTIEQQEAVGAIAEGALYLVASIIIRQNVTPVAKLRRQGR